MMCNRDKCSLYCRYVGITPGYKHLDRGDGICVHLNTRTNLCSIYDIRPKLCKAEEMVQPSFHSPQPPMVLPTLYTTDYSSAEFE